MSTITTLKIEPSQLVSAQNQKISTTSLKIAEAFGKQHKNIIQSIETLECSDEFRELNFQPTEETIQAGAVKRKRQFYHITKDGFYFLVMGFTGKKAAAWKEAFINAFNAMEAQLKGNALPDTENTRDQLNKAVKTLVSVLNKKGQSISYSDAWRLIHINSGMQKIETANSHQLQTALNYAKTLIEKTLIQPQTQQAKPPENLANLLTFTAQRIQLITEYEQNIDKHWQQLEQLKNQLQQARYKTTELTLYLNIAAKELNQPTETLKK